MALAAVPSSLTTVSRFAVLTGIVYVATRNVFLVGLFHGTGSR